MHSLIDRIRQGRFSDFPGGVYPPQRKELSNQTPIARMPVPEKLYVTVKQHIGVEGQIAVKLGDKVLKGQPLTRSMNPFAVPVHAPSSGEITAIGPHVSAHPSGLAEMTVEITTDGLDRWQPLSPMTDYQQHPKAMVVQALCDAGISGMGGAGFPTHIKVAPKKDAEFLIINGIECEPYISADDRLMREHAWQIRQGIDVICHLLQPKYVLIAIEDNKPQAIEAMQVACQENPDYVICKVETKYPAGGEKQLIQILTGREVPSKGLPIDVGVIMQNVGTCYAIADAIFAGKPLIQRVVTLTGQTMDRPGNVWALLGTPVSHLLDYAQYHGERQAHQRLIMGGPMMGFNLASEQVPVVKITNCILAPTDFEMPQGQGEQPCIRCSACADACPASLLPQQLYWHSKAKELDKAQDYQLFDCIECGACAYVCPSEIPLVHYYRVAKAEIRAQEEEKHKADKARERFEARKARLEQERAEREARHQKAAEARRQAMDNQSVTPKASVAEALARAKAKRQENASDGAETAAQDNKAKVAAALARAKAKAAAKGQTPSDEQAPIAEPDAQPESASNSSTTENEQKAKVAAAVARAKARAAAKQAPTAATAAAPAQKQETNEAESKQAKIAATVARAKAKAAKSGESEPSESAPSSSMKAEPESAAADDDKQAKVAAAVARAKAKAQERAGAQRSTVVKDSEEKPAADQGAPKTHQRAKKTAPMKTSDADAAANDKQAKVAAAIAKAKARAAAKTSDAESPAQEQEAITKSEPQTTAPALSSEEDKKRRVAAAIAKAKQRKQQDKTDS
ncbi:electron transport complex subunit RsxC [Aliiglaciecola sp. CAU 1673]|uniref:electron transport complex subunit RsxC n=1 Tax=Aliiglaciecola sp. CAU 1673 TaxID=3032595 RepID=UPI0023D9A38F|nr:electron transport complex subunit RsxC [Aliiglaciecola sp. CAU 1673]MDF2179320.1 electron transport complex subunit RsxC [Aliiglaciecola sp. CAU 1673]